MKHLYTGFSSLFLQYVVLYFFLFFTSCINEDNSECKKSKLLYIKSLNTKGEDITSSGEAGDVRLYLFDETKSFISQHILSSDDIKKKRPIRLDYENHNNVWVVAWSNLNGKEEVTPLSEGVNMKQAFVKLKKEATGFAINPDDLFHGIKNISLTTLQKTDTDSTILTIERKTALMSITVKGLDPQSSDYYFIIKGADSDTYDFEGTLMGNVIEYKKTGKFDTTQHFYETDIFSLYPIKEGDRILIYIYKGDRLIAIADKSDIEGKDIIPKEGMTNNIYIYLDENNPASITVDVVVTDWNEKHHWVEW